MNLFSIFPLHLSWRQFPSMLPRKCFLSGGCLCQDFCWVLLPFQSHLHWMPEKKLISIFIAVFGCSSGWLNPDAIETTFLFLVSNSNGQSRVKRNILLVSHSVQVYTFLQVAESFADWSRLPVPINIKRKSVSSFSASIAVIKGSFPKPMHDRILLCLLLSPLYIYYKN